ncbi:MAG TPA: hypothetical protein VMI10_26365 [Terriglobales bacterium]|nr:hypothetical protein [Terriglobales bacterium]
MPLFLVATYLLVGARFFGLIRQYAVNVLWFDQWEFDNATLFQHHSLLEMFRWQHGPHRQGLGALLQTLIEPWIHWNTRYEAFGIGAIIFSASVLALLLKVRLYGKASYSDTIIPLLFLTPLQYETLVVTPNPSHGPLPSLLTVLYCICWLVPSYRLKYICVLLVNFLLIYTGFGVFIGVVTPALLALDYYANIRHLAPKYQWGVATAMVISIASLASFFIGYKLDPAVACFSAVPALNKSVLYLWFIALMFANAACFKFSTLATLIGSIALLALVMGLSITFKRLLSRESNAWPRDAAITALLAYCGAYCLGTAYGRLCEGLAGASASRYTPYVVLGIFGLYLCALSNRRRNLRIALVLMLLTFALLGARPLNRIDAWELDYLSNRKSDWRECYLARHDIYECDALTRFQIDPNQGTAVKLDPRAEQPPEAAGLQEKLDFLERNRLNLYDNSQ